MLIWMVLAKIIKHQKKNDKLILRSQQRFRSEKHIVFVEEVEKIALSTNDDKEYNQSIHNKHAYGTKKDLVDIKEEVECKNIIKQYKNDEL